MQQYYQRANQEIAKQADKEREKIEKQNIKTATKGGNA
jgi:hypothetical protein